MRSRAFVAVQLPFLLEVGLVGVDRNRAELEFCRGPDHRRVDEELFCHGVRGPLGGVGNGHSAAITSTVSMQLAISAQQRRCSCSVNGSVIEGQRQRKETGSGWMSLVCGSDAQDGRFAGD